MIKQNKSHVATTSLFLASKLVYVFTLFLLSDFLHSSWDRSILSFSLLILLGSSLLLLSLQRGWSSVTDLIKRRGRAAAKREQGIITGNERTNSPNRQLVMLAGNGLAMLLAFTLFYFGLSHCGPLRGLLVEFCDSFLLSIPSLLFGFSGLAPGRRRGLLLFGAGVLLLLLSGARTFSHEPHVEVEPFNLAKLREERGRVGEEAAMDAANEAAQQENTSLSGESLNAAMGATIQFVPKQYNFLLFSLSEGTVGLLALLLSASIHSLQRLYEKSHAKEFGGRKLMHGVSMLIGCVTAIPAILLYEAMSGEAANQAMETVTLGTMASATVEGAENVHQPVGFIATVITILFIIVFGVVLQFYVDSLAQRNTTDPHLLLKLHLLLSFLFAALLDMWRGEERLTLPTVAAATFIFLGLHTLLQTAGKGANKDGLALSPGGSATLIPLYAPSAGKSSSVSGGGMGHGLTGFSLRELRMMFKHFMSDRTSMRIFIFLSINFLFMFVELGYGFYSNSLGLISDAGHMLFDCTALAIGLYASFVSKLKANGVYTYGYGRYEIISGYVNGVFLLFIGYFIFVESIERLFEPPEITSDSLVLVSVLGLGVNMIGLFFFHDHGGHGHSHGGGGHGHSHGGHGHSHGGGDHGHAHGEGGHGDDAQRNSNMVGIYLHVLADALGSVGVIISSLLVQYKGWTSADAICSIIISVMIIASVLPLVYSTLDVLNHCTPSHRESTIRSALKYMMDEIPGVLAYRQPHFWNFSDSEVVATLHVQVEESADEQRILQAVLDLFKSPSVGVANLSVQIEKGTFLNSITHEIKHAPLLAAGQM